MIIIISISIILCEVSHSFSAELIKDNLLISALDLKI